MKKYKIDIDKKNVMTIQKGINIGLKKEDEVKINLVGELSLEEALDLLNTATYEMLTTVNEKSGDKKELKKEIYQRAVLGFSLMIDKFYPEGAKNKFHGLTDEAVMKAQDEILRNKSKKG